jgi:F-type H+-transporting ATPase subunit delta
MALNKVAVKYASTLFAELADKKNLQSVYSDVEGMIAVFDQNENLKRVIGNPVFSDADKLAIIKKIFSGKVDDSLINFFEFLAQKERIVYTYDTLHCFIDVADRGTGFKKVEISSAFDLEPAETDRIRKELEELWNCKLKVTSSTDPLLLGGFIAKTDEIIVDASVKNQLEKLRKTFSRAGVSLN